MYTSQNINFHHIGAAPASLRLDSLDENNLTNRSKLDFSQFYYLISSIINVTY